jgi:hypothetical protein
VAVQQALPKAVESHRFGFAAQLVVVMTAAIALSACSSSSSGVLTQAEIPSSLGVKAEGALASLAREFKVPSRCLRTGFTVFGVPSRQVDTRTHPPASSNSSEIISSNLSCASPSDARMILTSALMLSGAHSINGIGDEAVLIDVNKPGLRYYIVIWSDNSLLRELYVLGALKDARITAGLTELLARRAAS